MTVCLAGKRSYVPLSAFTKKYKKQKNFKISTAVTVASKSPKSNYF